MTEIERIKKIIESAVTVFVGQDENEQGLVIPKQNLFHLITTIESQKEEIDQQHADYLALSQLNIDTITGARELEKQVESLKSITELVVKALESIKQMLDTDHSGYQKYLIWKLAFDALEEMKGETANG